MRRAVAVILLGCALSPATARGGRHPPRSKPVRASQAFRMAGEPILVADHRLWRSTPGPSPLVEVGRVPHDVSPFLSDGEEAWAVTEGWQLPSSLQAWCFQGGSNVFHLDLVELHADASLRGRDVRGPTAMDSHRIFVRPGLVIDRHDFVVTEGQLPPLPGAEVVDAATAESRWAYLARDADGSWKLAIAPDGAWHDAASWSVRELPSLGADARLVAPCDRFVVADATGLRLVVDARNLESVAVPLVPLPDGVVESVMADGDALVVASRDDERQLRIVRLPKDEPPASMLAVFDEDHDLGAFDSIDGRAWLASFDGTEHASLVAVSLGDGSFEQHWIAYRMNTLGGHGGVKGFFETLGNFFAVVILLPLWPFWPEC